ncbi:hypothetical protein Nepgr_006064 [Nepenthes gracilis]|uniref:Acid phosphatase n=1 Tax=Nepenthes gracilis TaxID=150966 RepID=A0AAD3S4D0_NEPGR|nr:hypothetical protein Nepgr_006064 [Nepenthes gracilis]
MDRAYSLSSLSSRGGSGRGSTYQFESGFYVTSFTATIFIVGLATLGVLLITMLIALAVMLQSCQSENSGVIQGRKLHYNDAYCRILVLHAELNTLEADEYPSACKGFAIHYICEGQHLTDLNFSIWMAETYFKSVTLQDNELGAVLIDIDDMFPSSSHFSNLLMGSHGDCIEFEAVIHRRRMLILRLYNNLQATGWPLILFTRKDERHRNATTENLISAGYRGWSLLIMRSDDEIGIGNFEYFRRRTEALQKEGFHIASVVSSQMDALTGLHVKERVFKLPSLILHKIKAQQ